MNSDRGAKNDDDGSDGIDEDDNACNGVNVASGNENETEDYRQK